MENKQTAVEWLENQLRQHYLLLDCEYILKKAKQMHKHEIEFTYNIGWADGHDEATNESPLFTTGEQYYNETYGGQDE
jgi:hypothetical protein